MSGGLTSSRFRFLRSGIIFVVVVALASLTFLLKPQSLEAQKLSGSTNSLPMAKPEEVGFSAERLQRVTDAMQKHIDAGEIAGVTTLIARNGKIVYFNAQGSADIDAKRSMQKDDIFNWASATKPITATAILMLVEQGKINLNDPVWKYLPEFKNQKVNVIGELVPASHDITVRDLLTHTSGLMSLGVPHIGEPDSTELLNSTLAAMIPRFAATPLDFQPGTHWAYSNWAGFDVLARIIEVTSGKPFDQFLKENIFDPLGMKDTGFDPFDDPARAARLAIRYTPSPTGLKKMTPVTPWSTAKNYFSGAAGLSGTTEDYWRFGQMLANGGEFNGKRLLSPLTVELMRANHVGDLFPGSNGFPQKGTGFGYGVQVVVDRAASDILLPNGTFGWVGASGCEGLMSPKENIVIVFMVGGGNNGGARTDFHTTAMQAFVQ